MLKKVLKKNRLIITSLVVMIIVAGYLNFTADQTTSISDNPSLNAKDKLSAADEQFVDVDVTPEEDLADIDAATALTETDAGQESQPDMSDTTDSTEAQDVNHIGEAVLTSVAARNFSAAAKLSREQTRASNQETYMEIVNSQDVSEEVRQNAMDSLMKLTDNAEKELAAETLLEAKGYDNSVVSINDTSVDVVICLNELTEVQRAQIEDIVKRKAEVETDRIVITTLQQ